MSDPSAETLFAEYLEAGDGVQFDLWVQSHPEHEADLRRIHADWRLLGAVRKKGVSFFKSGDHERPQPAPGLEAGKVIGDFRLVELIGQGGMGQVWEAEQVSLRRRVAVKFVRPERVTEKQLDYFAREARAGGRLAHPGIVAVHGYGKDDGIAWIAMELVEGCWTLRDFLDDLAREDEVPEDYDEQVARFIAQLAEALQAAHTAGVIHRDLKPQNILIAPDEKPKVTDFGLARITDESGLSETGDFAGTYFYMSPEQVAAKRMGIDHRTDIFSLGVVMYEMLTLRRPFQGDTTHQVAQQIVLKDPPDMRVVRSKIPRDLAVICGKALEKDPDRRYGSIGALAEDIGRHLQDLPIHAKPPTRAEQLTKWVKRNPTRAGVGLSVGISLLAISLLFVRLLDRNAVLDAQRTDLAASAKTLGEAVERTSKAVRRERREAYRANIRAATSAADSLDARALSESLLAAPEEHRGWEWDYLNARRDASLGLVDGSQRRIAGFRDEIRTPYGLRWARGVLGVRRGGDELLVGFEDGAAALSLQDLELTELDCGPGRPLAFSEDGMRLATYDAGVLRVVNTEDGSPVWEVEIPMDGPTARFCIGTTRLLLWEVGDAFCVLDGADGELLLKRRGIRWVGVVRGGDSIVVASGKDPVELSFYDGDTLERLVQHQLEEASIGSFALSHDGSMVAFRTSVPDPGFMFANGVITVLNLESGKRIHFAAPPGRGMILHFARQGARVWALSSWEIAAWDLPSGIKAYSRRDTFSPFADFLADSGMFAVAMADGSVEVCDSDSGESIARFSAPSPSESMSTTPLRFAGDGKYLVCREGSSLRIWPLGLRNDRWMPFPGGASSIDISDDGERVLVSGYASDAGEWDLLTLKQEAAFSGNYEIRRIRYGSSGEEILGVGPASPSDPNWRSTGLSVVRLWHGDGREMATVEGLHFDSGFGGRVVVGGGPEGLVCWDSSLSTVLWSERGRGGGSVVDVAGSGRLVLTRKGVFSVSTGELIYDFSDHYRESVSGDGRWAVCERDEDWHLIDLRNRVEFAVLPQEDRERDAQMGNSGEIVALIGPKSVRLWRPHDGGEPIRIPEMSVDLCRFSPDEKRIALRSGTRGVVVIADTESGAPLLRLSGLGGNEGGLEFSPDGTMLIEGSSQADGVKVWDSRPIRERVLERSH